MMLKFSKTVYKLHVNSFTKLNFWPNSVHDKMAIFFFFPENRFVIYVDIHVCKMLSEILTVHIICFDTACRCKYTVAKISDVYQ